MWESWGAVHVRRDFPEMLKSQMWRKSYICWGKFLLTNTYCIYLLFFLDLIQVSKIYLKVVIMVFCFSVLLPWYLR